MQSELVMCFHGLSPTLLPDAKPLDAQCKTYIYKYSVVIVYAYTF